MAPGRRRPQQRAAALLLLLTLAALAAVAQAFLPSTPRIKLQQHQQAAAASLRPGALLLREQPQSQSRGQRLPPLQAEGKGSGSKRRRRRSSGPAADGGSGSGGDGASPGARFDPTLTGLIEDERKAALPRLEDLKRGKEAAAKEAEALPTGGTPGILLPRELEELKAREKAKEGTKGAPPYFDLMTKASWAGIAVLVITEVVVQIFRTN